MTQKRPQRATETTRARAKTKAPAPPRVPESVSQGAFAAIVGVTRQTVSTWIGQGLPTAGRTGRQLAHEIPLAAGVQWRLRQLEARVAEAEAVDEVKKIRDVAEAMRAYARQAKNKQLEIDAAEIRIRAERRVGELIAAQRESVGLAKPPGSNQHKDRVRVGPEAVPTLAEAGIDKHLADRARKLAAVPKEEFESELRDWRERVQVESVRVTSNLVRAGEREQKRAERVAAAVPSGLFSKVIAEELGEKLDTVTRTARRYKRQFTVLPGGKLGLLETRS